jgi:holo-[acyl-carrier protein] synthase
MIVGIGVDVVHVRRLEHWRTVPGLLERFFHPEELSTALSRGGGASPFPRRSVSPPRRRSQGLRHGLSGIVLKESGW